MTTPNGQPNQPANVDPEAKAFLDSLPADIDVDGEDAIPAEVKALDDGTADEATKKKAQHAFAEQRRKLREAKALLARGNQGQPAAPSPGSAAGLDERSMSGKYLQKLQMEAMQNLGVVDPENPVLALEIARLYNRDRDRLDALRTADARAAEVFGQTMEQFPQLTPQDQAEMQRRLQALSPLDRANPDVVRREVHIYLGENFERISTGTPPAAPATRAGPAARTPVRRGVTPPAPPEGGGDEKPATVEELREMKQIGLNDVRVLRDAKRRKGVYAG